MSDPQAWTLSGVFSAAMLGGLTLVATMLTRVIRAEVGGLRAELVGVRGELGSEIGGLRGELKGEIGGLRGEVMGEIGGLRGEVVGEIGALRAEMHGRFATVDSRLDHFDRDVHTLSERMWRGEQHY